MRSLPRLAPAAIAIVIAIAFAAPAAAQNDDPPYWASIDTQEAYMRVGAGRQFPILWVYKREGLPVKVIRRMQGWRYVEEPDGTTGWISESLLSRQRTAIVTADGLTPMRAEPADSAELRWNLETGVVGDLGDCSAGWCQLDVDGHAGWVEQQHLWGPGEP